MQQGERIEHKGFYDTDAKARVYRESVWKVYHAIPGFGGVSATPID